jgi:fidgetin-like protein 1
MQCKERVDLLEALRQSRQEKEAADASTEESNAKIQKTSSRTPRQSSESESNERGFIGNGTIPAIGYPDLSRPAPPLPQRPALVSKNSSEQAVVGSRSAANYSSLYPISSSSSRTIPPAYSTTLAPPMKKSSRSPSPEKGRTMLHTLRSGDRSSRKPRTSGVKQENPVTNKAASLAWQSVGRPNKDRLGRSLDTEADQSSTMLSESGRKDSASYPTSIRPSSSNNVRYDSRTRTLVHESHSHLPAPSPPDLLTGKEDLFNATGRSNGYPFPPTDPSQPGAVSGSLLTTSALRDLIDLEPPTPPPANSSSSKPRKTPSPPSPHSKSSAKLEPVSYPTYLKEYPETSARRSKVEKDLPLRRKHVTKEGTDVESSSSKVSRKPVSANISSPRHRDRHQDRDDARRALRRETKKSRDEEVSSQSVDDDTNSSGGHVSKPKRKLKQKQKEKSILADPTTPTSGDSAASDTDDAKNAWEEKVKQLMKNLPRGVDGGAAKQIFNEIVVHGDEVHWDDVAGLDIAKNALKEAVVYPFLRPDLFMGLREPARGMLLFGPPGTGKTMLARAVATESRSTFFSISASSLTSKYLGESEKLVRALFSLAKALAPSIIFVDEIDSLLSSRSGSGEHEATRRIKTEFLIQWSDLQRAAAGREQSEKEKERGDASRVLVLAATNLPWAIDEAARRRFVRRQYIPLPEDETRATQLRTLLGHQKHSLGEDDIQRLVELTDGLPSLSPSFEP